MSKTKNKTTRLIVAASENDPDMLYAFVIPSEVEESLLEWKRTLRIARCVT